MALHVESRNPRAPCKETIGVEDVRLLLKQHVSGGVESITTWDDTESFLEDHKQFMIYALLATERLNPKTVERASRIQFEGSPRQHKRFGEMVASAFSYIKGKSKKCTDLKFQHPVVRELCDVLRVGRTAVAEKLPQQDESSTAATEAAQGKKALIELPLRTRSRSPRCASTATGSQDAWLPADESAIRALYAPFEAFSPVRKPELLDVESSQEAPLSPLVIAPPLSAPEATVARAATGVDQQCEMKDRSIDPSI